MIKAQVNKKSFEIESQDDSFLVNGESVKWDLEKLNEGYFHILYNNKSYVAEVVKADHTTKIFSIKLNGKTYPVELKDRFDILLEKMGMNSSAGSKVNMIKAPMPGLIIDLKVKTGDSVKPGDTL